MEHQGAGFAALAEHAADAVARIDRAGRHLWANHTAARLAGVTREAMIGRRFGDFRLPAEAVAEVDAHIEAAFATGAVREFSTEFEKEGVRRSLDVRVLPEWTVGGAPCPAPPDATALVVVRDATAHRAAERALRDSEERFQQMAESIGAVVWLSDVAERRVLYVSPAFDQVWGIPRDELYADPGATARLVHPDDRAGTAEAFARMWRQEQAEHEYRIVRPDGELRWLVSRAYPVHDAEGRPYRVAGIATDITARKLAEEALRASEARLAEAQRVGSVGSWELTFATGDAWWSDALYALFGRDKTAGPLTQDAFFDAMHPDDRDRVRAELVAHTTAARPFDIEFRVPLADGRVRTLREHGEFRFGPDGLPWQVLGTVQDVTDQRALEAQLRQAQKMEAVGQLAGGVAHDFNNLLQVILTHAEFALDALPAADPVRDDVAAIHEAGERAARLTRQLLAFSRKQLLQPKVLDLNTVVLGVAPMLRRLIGEDIVVDTRLTPGVGPVTADPAQLEQVLVNLAVNARDAMPNGGRVTIETAEVTHGPPAAEAGAEAPAAGRYARLTVTDTGAGMDEATRGRVFEPFFTTKALGKGTGLGLSTVYGIVRQSGGWVRVTSAPGRGTTVEVDLPLVDPPAGMPSAAAAAQRAGGVGTVLLVEDEAGVRGAVRRMLARHGFTVLEAATAEAALALVARDGGTIDLVLTDVVMPGMSGRAFADRLSEERPALRVLFMSGYTDDEILRRGLAVPGAAFIEKPFTPSTLLAAVRRALGR